MAAVLAIDLVVWGGDGTTRMGGWVPPGVVIVATAVAYAPLLARSRRPDWAFVPVWAFSLAGLILPDYEPFAGLILALYAVARRCEQRRAVLGLALTFVPIAVNSVNAVEDLGSAGAPLAFFVLLWAALYGAVWGMGRAGYRNDRVAEERAALHEEQARLAVIEERRRLARELHDIVAHSVSAIVLQAAGARAVGGRDPARVTEALNAIELTGAGAMRELHRLLGLMRQDSSPEPDLAMPGLDDVPQLLETTRASGVPVEFTETGVRAPLDASVAGAAFRVIQESLANAMKHGGTGGQARVSVVWHTDHVRIQIRSVSGSGDSRELVTSDPTWSSGHGLRGLRERVDMVEGLFSARPVAGGFLTDAVLPVSVLATSSAPGGADGDR